MSNRILPIFALFIAVGIFFGYVRQTWNGEIAEIKIAIANDDKALAAASEYNRQQNALASARNAIDETSMGRLEILLPDSVDNVGIILGLNAIAARNGISISSIDVMPNAKGTTGPLTDSAANNSGVGPVNPVSSIDLSLSVVGGYVPLQNFLMEVEKSQRLLDVRDIIIKGSDTGIYKYNMILRLYWLR